MIWPYFCGTLRLMTLPKSPPDEIIQDLRELALASALELRIDIEETTEADAADFMQAAVKFLTEIKEAGGALAERAAAILNRLA
jgi:hypothetical protein